MFTTCATFDVTFVGSIDSRHIVSYGEDGQPTREIRHVSFTGTLTGPAGSLPYSGHFTRTEDLTEREARFTGVHFMVTRADGPPLLAAGIDAFSLDSSDDDRATGRLPQDFYAEVCASSRSRRDEIGAGRAATSTTWPGRPTGHGPSPAPS